LILSNIEDFEVRTVPSLSVNFNSVLPSLFVINETSPKFFILKFEFWKSAVPKLCPFKVSLNSFISSLDNLVVDVAGCLAGGVEEEVAVGVSFGLD